MVNGLVQKNFQILLKYLLFGNLEIVNLHYYYIYK